MNLPLLRYTFGSNLVRLAVIAAGLVLMGIVMPVMYAAFGEEMSEFIDSVPFFSQLINGFGGGNVLSLTGSMAFAFQHPFTLLLVGIMAIAFPALAIAGERDRGTLEVTLSRPISRRGLLLTLFLAGVVFVALLNGVLAATTAVTAVAVGFGDEVEIANLAQLWVVSSLLFVVFMGLAFVVSVESDRAGPAIGIPANFVLLNYLAFNIGGSWPDVAVLEDWSMFNLLKAQSVLTDGVALSDVVVLLACIALLAAVAFYRFPRRDLPAPS
ncbi:MAG: ABC transporter permease subunit [Candidatus Limnocylindrales bacterium]